MKHQVKQLLFGKLAKASSWLFLGGVAGGILGYLFQIIMGNMLSVKEYGVFSAIMAIYAIMSAPFQTLFMVVSRKVSAIKSEINSISSLYFALNYKTIAFSFLFIVIFYFVSGVMKYLLIDSMLHFYLLIGLLITSTFMSINRAYLQGLQNFKWLSASTVISITLKILFAFILVYFGFGVAGALGGVIFSTLIILALTYLVIRPSLSKNDSTTIFSKTNLLLKSAIPVLAANIAFAFMTQIDMVLVKYYFSHQETGIYASASILGKAVMYLPGGIALALFPMVAENHASGKSSIFLMIQAAGMTIILSLIGALFYYFFADSIIVFLYGVDYIESANVLKYFGFAMIPMALIMVAENFLIAMGRVLFAYLFMLVAPFQVIAVYYYHDNLLNIVTVLFITGIILVTSGYGLLWRMFKK